MAFQTSGLGFDSCPTNSKVDHSKWLKSTTQSVSRTTARCRERAVASLLRRYAATKTHACATWPSRKAAERLSMREPRSGRRNRSPSGLRGRPSRRRGAFSRAPFTQKNQRSGAKCPLERMAPLSTRGCPPLARRPASGGLLYLPPGCRFVLPPGFRCIRLFL
jgi:hypothetical protein